MSIWYVFYSVQSYLRELERGAIYIYILYLLFTFSIIHVHVSISPEITHGLCNFGFFFLVFSWKTKKPKNQNCTDHVCRDGLPRDHPWSVQFCFFFGFLVFHGKPKNQKTKIAQTMSVEMGSPEITHGLCNFGFLVFWFFMENQKTKKPKLHRPCLSRWAPQRSPMVCAILVFWFFGFPRFFGFHLQRPFPKDLRFFLVVCNFGFLGFWVFPPKWHKPCLSW